MARVHLVFFAAAIAAALFAAVWGYDTAGQCLAASAAALLLVSAAYKWSGARRSLAGSAIHPDVFSYFGTAVAIAAFMAALLTAERAFALDGEYLVIGFFGPLPVLCLGAAARQMRIDYDIPWWRAIAVVVPLAGAFVTIEQRHRRLRERQTADWVPFDGYTEVK